MEQLLEAVFTLWYVPRLYNERESEKVVRRVGGSCVMTASPRGREPISRGTSTSGDTADSDYLIRAVVNYRLRELAIMLNYL
jgi:hypothetical protein